MNDKRLGIIGGMGPEATVSFYRRIIAKTQVSCDQDHYRVIIDSNPKIPDRTSAILRGTASPLPALIETAHNLEKLDVEIAGIPCITAHYYLDELRKHTSIKIVSAIESVNDKLNKQYPDKIIGILRSQY